MADPLIIRLARSVGASLDDRFAPHWLTNGRVWCYKPHTDIVREGDPPCTVRVVVSGWVCRYKQLPDGRRQIIALLLPGDVCDHYDGLNELDHALGALTEATLREIDPVAYTAAVQAMDSVGRTLQWAASVEVAIQREWTFNVGRRDKLEGLAHLFCELYHRLDAVGLVEDSGYHMPLTQLDLADALGATAVHINRVLKALRGAGLVVLSQRRLTIPDLAALEKVALFDPAYLHLHRGCETEITRS